MHIIKDGRIADDAWRHAGDEEPVSEGPVTLSLERWQRERSELANHAGPLGLRLRADQLLEDLTEDLCPFSLIVLEFASLRDGRSFSQARLLRERYGFKGEIRAKGDFIRDQMFFLSRVGVNAFEFADENALSSALPALTDFSVVYQPAAGDGARNASCIGDPARPRY